jgi:hypothetical protein
MTWNGTDWRARRAALTSAEQLELRSARCEKQRAACRSGHGRGRAAEQDRSLGAVAARADDEEVELLALPGEHLVGPSVGEATFDGHAGSHLIEALLVCRDEFAAQRC